MVSDSLSILYPVRTSFRSSESIRVTGPCDRQRMTLLSFPSISSTSSFFRLIHLTALFSAHHILSPLSAFCIPLLLPLFVLIFLALQSLLFLSGHQGPHCRCRMPRICGRGRLLAWMQTGKEPGLQGASMFSNGRSGSRTDIKTDTRMDAQIQGRTRTNNGLTLG